MSAVGWELVSGGDILSLTNDGSGEEFWFETTVDGWSLGSPDAVKAIFSSLAADGDDERIMRHGNRQVPFQVKACGADLAAVSLGERALRLMLGRAPNLELRYTPPDDIGEVTVFDVILGEMPLIPDDLAMVRSSPWAKYAVTLTCKPFTRPVDPVTTTLTYGTDTPTTLDAGTSTTGWSSTGATLSAVTVNTETAVKVLPAAPLETGAEMTIARTSLSLTAAKPYMAIDVATSADGTTVDTTPPASVVVKIGSSANVSAIGSAYQASTGFTRYFFPHALAGTSQPLVIYVKSGLVAFAGAFIGGAYAYASAPGSGLMIADVEGSERAPMTVAVSKSTAGSLGETFIYSDPTMLEYGWNPGDSATWPNAPAGSYVAVATSAGLDNHIYTLTINDSESSTRGGVSEARYWDFDLGARRDGRIGAITTGWDDQWTGAGSGSLIPDFLLFRDEPGVTSLVHLSDVPHRYLFVDSPTIESPRIGVWGGSAADGSDAVSLLSVAESLDPMTIKPPRYAVFVSTGVTGIVVEMTYYPLSHTFVPSPGLVS
jgi:hypothetical protein